MQTYVYIHIYLSIYLGLTPSFFSVLFSTGSKSRTGQPTRQSYLPTPTPPPFPGQP